MKWHEVFTFLKGKKKEEEENALKYKKRLLLLEDTVLRLRGLLDKKYRSVPFGVILKDFELFDHGADKYAPLDWRNREFDEANEIVKLMGHLDEYLGGSAVDKDSGLHPLYHVRGRCAIILDMLEGTYE